MVILEISKSHEDSPSFRSGLTKLEGVTGDLEQRLKRLCSLCDERQQAAERERQLTQELVTEFEGLAENSLDGSSNITSSVEVITTALKQLTDNQERMFEQINIGIVKPLKHFVSHDLEQLRSSKKAYKKARSEATQAAEKFCQCKKHEMGLMTEMSAHLFESRYDLHKATLNYAMDLNLIQSKRVPDFLQRLVDFMTTQLSYFHLGHITVKDTETQITTLYSTLEGLRREATTKDTQQRSEAIQLLEQHALSSAKHILHLQINDLHIPSETAKSNVSRLMNKVVPINTGRDLVMDPPVQTDALTKHGYLCFAEPRTFGTAWIRLYFNIENGQLTSQESKVKVPISLSLNVCNVKPAEAVDTERSFCFKVTSPTRTLLLQAEGSQAMKEWMDVLTNAITHALHALRQSITPERETVRGPGDESPMPIKPPRPKRKSILLKDIYSAAGNELCADCKAPSPKWASVNLGVVLCIECSGVHRSLGVYISQARSLTLDTLKPEWVAKLKMVGNTQSNAVYERQLPEDFDRGSVKKADGRRQFITDKYTHMLYTSDEDKQRITAKRQAARVESLKKSGVHTFNGSTKQDELEDGWVKVSKDDNSTASPDSAVKSHDQPTKSPALSDNTPEASHDLPQESHDPPEQSHDTTEVSHDPPEEAPPPSHDLPEESPDQPEVSHDQPKGSHDPPVESQTET